MSVSAAGHGRRRRQEGVQAPPRRVPQADVRHHFPHHHEPAGEARGVVVRPPIKRARRPIHLQRAPDRVSARGEGKMVLYRCRLPIVFESKLLVDIPILLIDAIFCKKQEVPTHMQHDAEVCKVAKATAARRHP